MHHTGSLLQLALQVPTKQKKTVLDAVDEILNDIYYCQPYIILNIKCRTFQWICSFFNHEF